MAKDDNEAYRISAEQLIEETKNREVIPLCLSADIGLGGGIPLGATALIGGKYKSGKTSTALQYGANAQQLYGSKIFYYNIEGRLSNLVLSQTRNLKTDADHFEVVMPPAVFDKDGKRIGHKKVGSNWWFEKIGESINQNPRSIQIVDSLAALSSEKEVSEGMGFQGRGDGQKLEAQFVRKFGDIIVPNRVTVFLLTHIQANTSGYGPALQMKAGNAVKHLADVMLFCRSVEKWDENSEGKVLGHNINYIVEASALGPPFAEIQIPLRYGEGVDTIKDLIVHCVNWDLIRVKGSWYSLPFIEEKGKLKYVEWDALPKDSEGVKLQGEVKVRNWLSVQPEAVKILEQLIRTKIFG